MLPDAILRRLSDDADAGEFQEDILNESLNSAAAEIDMYISVRITPPTDEPYPDILSKLNLDIGIYNLYSRLKEEIPGTRQVRYDNAIRMLKDFAAGKAEIAGLVVRIPATIFSRGKIFTEAFMEKF